MNPLQALIFSLVIAFLMGIIYINDTYNEIISNKIHSMHIELQTLDSVEITLNIKIKGGVSKERKAEITKIAKETMLFFDYTRIGYGEVVIRDKVRLLGVVFISTDLWRKTATVICETGGCYYQTKLDN